LGKLHTHYDNLKVTRNAPPEVIRAAYKTLSQKYHPDRHPGNANADAVRVMTLINQSYQVLSDPAQRATHDRWIAQQEATAQPTGARANPAQHPEPSSHSRTHYQSAPVSPAPTQTTAGKGGGLVAHVLRHWLLYGFAGLLVWLWAIDKPRQPPVGPKPYQAQAPAKATYVRPVAAPNGQPWPAGGGYVQGYQQLNTRGRSSVTVDNSRNDSDVFVKLVALDGAQAFPARQFYIPAFSSFTVKNVAAGGYDVRYRDLSTGGLSRSETMTLQELRTEDGVQFSNITMTLYKVKNGNMQTFGLAEAEF